LSRAHEIFLGDLARALRVLQPTDQATATRVARLLGLDVKPVLAQAMSTQPPSTRPASDHRLSLQEQPQSRPQESLLLERRPSRPATIPSSLSASPRTSHTEPTWLRTQQPLAVTEADDAPHSYEPLLKQSWSSGILVNAGMRLVRSHQVDVKAMVRTLGSGRTPDRIVFRQRWSRRQPVLLLLDVSPGMSLYHDDADWTRKRLTRLFGADQVIAARFSRTPLLGAGSGARLTWRPWVPPIGATVLLFSDLGQGKPPFGRMETGSLAEWLEFGELLNRRRVNPVCLTPYRPGRFPESIRRRFVIIQLGRRTTPKKVRELVGRRER